MATYKFESNPYGYGTSATITFPPDANGRKPFKMYSRSSEVKINVNGQIKPVLISDIKDDGMYFNDKGTPVKIDINTIQLGGKSRKRKSRKNKSRRYRRV